MRKIIYGLLWFQLLLMNVGLAMGTIGLVLMIVNYGPLIQYPIWYTMLGLTYTFFYILLVIGVIELDATVISKGIKYVHNELIKDAKL